MAKLTEKDIRNRATSKVYARGLDYYQSDMLFDTVKRGNTLEGYSEASSQPDPYHIQVTLTEGIASTSCDCEYEYEGDCKHIVALLLKYLHEPDAFEEKASLDSSLAARSKEELIALIQRMVMRHPDLQTLVDIAEVSASASAAPSVDVGRYRKELGRAMKHYSHWDDDGALDDVLEHITQDASDFGSAGQWQNASALYRLVLEEMLHDGVDFLMDGADSLFDWINTAIEGLSTCLDQPILLDNDAERHSIQDTLLMTYMADMEWGGAGWADEVPDILMRSVRQPDIARLRNTITAAQTKAKGRSHGSWQVNGYEEFLMDLDTLDSVDVEQTLKRLRDAGMYNLLIGKLLELKRSDEAITLIEKQVIHPHERMRELQRLSALGYDDEAVRIGTATALREYYHQLVDWLLMRFEARGDTNAFFDWQLRRMEVEPSLKHYQALHHAAEPTGQWQAVRTTTLQNLVKVQHYALLTRIYLYEKAWDDAWKTLEKARKTPAPKPVSMYGSFQYVGDYYFESLELDVAKESRFDYPERALPIFVKHARRNIDHRSRDYYRQAAEYLSMAQELYLETDREHDWLKLINGIREEFKKLPALQDELRKAKL